MQHEPDAEGKYDFGVSEKIDEVRFLWPPDSRPILDADGNIVYETEKGEDGETLLDDFKRPILKMKDGKPVALMTPQPKREDQIELWIRFIPISRRMRMEAINSAVRRYQAIHRERGISIDLIESELVKRCVRASNIKGIPGNGFEALADHALGDEITKITRIWEQIGGKEAIESGKLP